MNKVNDLFEAIRDDATYEQLKKIMQCIPVHEFVKATYCGLDVLQYAILHLHSEAITLIESLGYFHAHKSPSAFPYLHLAAWVNSYMILQILLQHRAGDLETEVKAVDICDWRTKLKSLGHCCTYEDIPLEEILFAKGEEIKQEDDRDCVEECTMKVLDVAACRKNLKSVNKILERSGKSLVEAAVISPSYKSLQLLIETNHTTKSELTKAFKFSLLRKQPNFVKLLLKQGIDVKGVLNGLNPFYVMYVCSSFSENCRPENERWKTLPETTTVLICNGFDVNESAPPGTFPLYSLVDAMSVELAAYNEFSPIYHIQTLDVLLENGADPWFNDLAKSEIDEISNDLPKYSSSLHALFSMILNYTNKVNVHIEAAFSRCLHKVLERPVPRREKLSACLCVVFEQMGKSHGKGSCINIVPYIRLVLKEGAELQYRGVHLVEVYLMSLIDAYSSVCVESGPVEYQFGLLNCILDLLVFEKKSTVSAMVRKIREHTNVSRVHYDSENFPELDEFYDNCFRSLIDARQSVDRLSDMCKVLVWKRINGQKSKLEHLGIPKNLQKLVLELF